MNAMNNLSVLRRNLVTGQKQTDIANTNVQPRAAQHSAWRIFTLCMVRSASRSASRSVSRSAGLLLLLCTLLLVSCRGGGGAGTGASGSAVVQQAYNETVELNVLINDNFYGETDTNIESPPVWRIPQNSDVIVNMENLGDENHNWAIVREGITVPVPFEEGQASELLEYGAGMVYGQNRTTITLNAPNVGVYQVICTVEGHYPYMQGVLVVE